MQLTSLDQKVLLAAINLHPTAYGVSIRDHIRDLTKEKPPSIGSLYAAIERLKDRGLVTTRLGDPTDERGGRAKMYVTVTAKGQATLQRSLQAIKALTLERSLQAIKALQTKGAPSGGVVTAPGLARA
jgi:PadR family transcriptional regulator, regulatory protein PadR